MPHAERDPQRELVRRYARILRSAPAEAVRAQSAPATGRTGELMQAPRFRRNRAEVGAPASSERATTA